MVRLCSVTMEGPGLGSAGAISTVNRIVDESIVIHPGVIADFAAARNKALETAQDRGFEWAMMLDTDERIQCVSPGKLRTFLETTETDVVLAMDLDNYYVKERIFRLPPAGRYVGPTHEAFVHYGEVKREVYDDLKFTEIDRGEEAYRYKFTRDRTILEKHTAENPDDPRWWYYLGDTYVHLDLIDEAIDAFSRCWSLNGFTEESAWAAYRIGTFLANDDKYEEAIDWCMNGMKRHVGMAELSWLAGWCFYQTGHDPQAVYWSIISTTFGNFAQRRYPVRRMSFRTPHALWEWPYDTLRHALDRMGDEAGAKDADTLYHAAKKRREMQ